jgi:RNA polymerase sigma-70 factor (ECF subfamily)
MTKSARLFLPICIFKHSFPHREVRLDPAAEQALIAELKSGSQRALDLAYRQYSGGVLAYCLKILGDRQSAEDVVQETFIRVGQSAQSVQNHESFRSWIFRIARNEALMQIRKRQRNGQIDERDVWDEETPHHLLVSSERSEMVNRMLDGLKHEYKEALVLLVYENMSYAEIAAVTGVTESSVKSRIYRARKAMVERLKGLG